ncbi:hypothetical protein B0H10DRAFT_893920 [Mycena sp. CBHHK59/15]|nr:hypothetical protein B0H10DRAFT_893920 [Mycena sp. CBHHK59/15]
MTTMPACLRLANTCKVHVHSYAPGGASYRSPTHVCCLIFWAMAFSLGLHSPPKWLVFRSVALNRVLRLMRRLTLTLASHPYLYTDPGKSDRSPCSYSDGQDPMGKDDFCVFEVEGTQFKVHISLLHLEIYHPSPSVYSAEPLVEDHAITDGPAAVALTDTAENFRYFLWDLQALCECFNWLFDSISPKPDSSPHELSLLRTNNLDINITPILDRLLNITEMARKHNLAPLEARAVESLRQFILSGYFHSASPTQHCRILNLAVRHADLLADFSRRLTSHILRRAAPLDPALVLAMEEHALRRPLGAVYYCELVAMERRLEGRAATQPVFPRALGVERRMRLLAAHSALTALWAHLRACPPPLPPPRGCRAHARCLSAWAGIWGEAAAAAADEAEVLGSADVLGRLRAMAPVLRGMVSETPWMTVECALAALEAVYTLRDQIVEGLVDLFV